MTGKVLPLIYFSHAELKAKENLNINLEVINSDHINRLIQTNKSTFDANNTRSKRKLKLSLSDLDMNYEAVEDEEQPFLIGSFDKTTSSISVFNTPCFNLKPECYLNANSTEPGLTVDNAATYSEKLDSLTAAFGSTKKRKAMRTKQNNRLDSKTLESAVSAAVDESKKNVNLSAEAQVKKILFIQINIYIM
jgi:hypothetical protein